MARTVKTVPIVLPSKAAAPTAETWELHVGHIKLFITGPGEDDWFPVSNAYYTGPVGNITERRIAQAAVHLLNASHRYERNLCKKKFAAIYQRAKRKIKADQTHDNA